MRSQDEDQSEREGRLRTSSLVAHHKKANTYFSPPSFHMRVTLHMLAWNQLGPLWTEECVQEIAGSKAKRCWSTSGHGITAPYRRVQRKELHREVLEWEKKSEISQQSPSLRLVLKVPAESMCACSHGGHDLSNVNKFTILPNLN